MDQNQTNQTINTGPTNMNPAPSMNSMPVNNHKKMGPIVAIIVVVLALIVAAVYIFSSKSSYSVDSYKETYTAPVDTLNKMDTTSYTETTSQSVTPITSQSNDPQSLENDINASTNGLDEQNF